MWCCSPRTEKTESTRQSDTLQVTLTDEQYRTAGIVCAPVQQRMLQSTLQVSGMLDVPPQNLISVSAPLGGFLQATDMLQGKRVLKGEKIATIRKM